MPRPPVQVFSPGFIIFPSSILWGFLTVYWITVSAWNKHGVRRSSDYVLGREGPDFARTLGVKAEGIEVIRLAVREESSYCDEDGNSTEPR